jgi:hypothetical protein
MAAERTYSAPEAHALAGVSYRQLDYWDRTRIVRPSTLAQGSGTQRRYTLDDVIAVALVGAVAARTGRPLPEGALGIVQSTAVYAVVDESGEPPVLRGVDSRRDLLDLIEGHIEAVTVIDVQTLRVLVTERARGVRSAA